MGRPRLAAAVAAALGAVGLIVAGCASPQGARPAQAPRPVAAPSPARRPAPSPVAGPVSQHRAVLSASRTSWAAPKGWTITEDDLSVGGLRRSYLLARPDDPVGQLPVLMVLHGREMTPSEIASTSGFLGVVGQAVVVYPAGIDRSWNAGYCCGAAHALGVNDVAFLEDVVTRVLAAVPGTSAHRVYLVGYSNGGRMAYRLACADPGAYAAIATVEAVPVAPCGHIPAVPIAVVASSGDPLLTIPADAAPKYIEGRAEPTVEAVVSEWKKIDGCSPAAIQQRSGLVSVQRWSDCDRGARVEFAEYAGGSHHWPEGDPTTPSAQSLIWSFFDTVASTRPAVAR